MAFRILAGCTGCWACAPLCPSGAIRAATPHFLIDAQRCSECDGDYADPQCASICPIEGVIVDSAGVALNPPGSLTGIPPARWAAVRAEIQAR
ncbi:MAG: 4Fe-4S binding protein [Gammaproteobacteria bacterium]|jgi:Fe-S-cluster-containing hydrogenase component 2|nr:4Fe-4S binding protein [Chromatiaceae bacterium]MCU0935522.1 4Fe-4S binding protein [Gammaproteobacteria bacterium]